MQLDTNESNDGSSGSSSNAANVRGIPIASPSYSPDRLQSGSPDFSPRIPSPLNPHASASPPPTPRHLHRRPSQLSQFVGYTPTQAETRRVESREDTVELSSLLGPDDRLRFFRCIDNDLLPALIAPAERAKAVKVMETMLLLLENALEKGLGEQGDHKYLQIKLSNPAIRTKLDLDGKSSKQKGAPSIDYLHLCGWKFKVQDFQEYLHFPENPSPKTLAEMRTGHRILATRVAKEHETAAKTSERQADAKKEESSRVKNALAQYREDREKVKEVGERERLARTAAAARSPTSPSSGTTALSPGTPASSLPPH